MSWSTRLYCTVQQMCALLFIMGPFWYMAFLWMAAHGPMPTWGSLWDIACLSLIFLGLLMLLDNAFTWLNAEFKREQ